MKKFKINAIRTDEYIVEIDETIWNKKYLDDWNSVFGGCDTVQDLAEHISFLILRFGCERFLEGFGYLYVQGEDGRQKTLFERDDNGKCVIVTEFADGIKVTIMTEDDEYDFETEIIKVNNMDIKVELTKIQLIHLQNICKKGWGGYDKPHEELEDMVKNGLLTKEDGPFCDVVYRPTNKGRGYLNS